MPKKPKKHKPDLPNVTNKQQQENKRVVIGDDDRNNSQNQSRKPKNQPRKPVVKDLNIHLDIFANGLDFIANSLDPILEGTFDINIKYSILHLHAGIELIFKEILKDEHWSLIFQNVDLAHKKHLKTGDFVGVNNRTAITRLSSICGITFTKIELFSLEDLRRRRNIIEHYVFPKEEDPAGLKSTVSEVLIIILELIEENFDEGEIKGSAAKNLETIKQKSMEFKEFVDKKIEKLQPALKKFNAEFEILTCPNCFQNTFVLSDKLQCLFCKYTADPEDVVEAYITNVLKISRFYEDSEGGYYPLEDCPSCYSHTLLVRESDYICFSCLTEYDKKDLDHCGRCNRLYCSTEEDGTICEDCWAEVISSSD